MNLTYSWFMHTHLTPPHALWHESFVYEVKAGTCIHLIFFIFHSHISSISLSHTLFLSKISHFYSYSHLKDFDDKQLLHHLLAFVTVNDWWDWAGFADENTKLFFISSSLVKYAVSPFFFINTFHLSSCAQMNEKELVR